MFTGLSHADLLSWPFLLELKSDASVQDVKLVLDILQRGPDCGKALIELLQCIDFASEEPKFKCLGVCTGLGDIIASRSH